MDPFGEDLGDNVTQSISTQRKRIFDRTHLILSPKHEVDHNPRLKFGDEPRITAAILPPPPVPTFTNSTKQLAKNDQFNQLNSTTNSSFNNKSSFTNETSLLDNSNAKSITKLGSTVGPPTTTPTTNEGGMCFELQISLILKYTLLSNVEIMRFICFLRKSLHLTQTLQMFYD